MREKTRRDLLKLGVGAGQLALLNRLGVLDSSRAHAQTSNGPTKLLTLYVAGGWIPQFLFSPLKLAETNALMPTPRMVIGGGEPYSYTAAHVQKNLDGSPVDDMNWENRPLRMARLWDEAELTAGRKDRRLNLTDGSGLRTSALGWSWVNYQLWRYASVLHGVDMGTAAHDSGQVSMMCGIAGPSFQSPALHAFVANAMLTRFPDRALPHVMLGGLAGERVNLPPASAALSMANVASAGKLFSERDTTSWGGLTGRTAGPMKNWDGSDGPDVRQTRLERFISERALRLSKKTGSSTDALYQSIYDSYRGYSQLLAKEVVARLEGTPAYEHVNMPGANFPFWSENGFMGFSLGSSVASSGNDVVESTSLALKLLKSDLTTSISLKMPAGIYFDTHNDSESHFPYLRATMEQIGRFLGEMSLTPSSTPGKTLLDDTLVLVMSEFGRTWNRTGGTDHWPTTSVIFAGGNSFLAPNRMVGGYATNANVGAGFPGYMGANVSMKGEDGRLMTTSRPPQSRDVVFTALKMFGIDAFLPGGPGDVVGLHA